MIAGVFTTIMARIGVDGRSFSKGMDGIEKKARSTAFEMERNWGKKLAGIKAAFLGAFSVAAVKKLEGELVKLSSNLVEQSEKLAISTDKLQGYFFAFEQGGVAASKAATILQRLNRRAGDAVMGSTQMQEAFAKFGFTVDDLKKKNLDEIFETIVKKVQDTRTTKEEMSALFKLIDTEGVAGLAALKEGFLETAEAAPKIPEATLTAFKDIGGAMTTFKHQFLASIAEPMLIFIKTLQGMIVDLTARFKILGAVMNAVFGSGKFKDLDARFAEIFAEEEQIKSAIFASRSVGVDKRSKILSLPQPPIASSFSGSTKSAPSLPQFSASGSSLASIGGFTQAGEAISRLNIAKQQLTVLEKIREHTRDTARKLDDSIVA